MTDTETTGDQYQKVARIAGTIFGMLLGAGLSVVIIYGLQAAFPAFFAEYVPTFAEFAQMYLAAGKFALALLLGPPGLMIGFWLYKRRVLDGVK